MTTLVAYLFPSLMNYVITAKKLSTASYAITAASYLYLGILTEI